MRKLFMIGLIALAVAGLIFTGCSSTASPAPAPAPASSSAPSTAKAPASSTAAPASGGPTEILIGTSAALTGAMAGQGQGDVYGLKQSVADINNQGGIYVADLGKKLPVRLMVVDSQSDPTKAANLSEAMILSDKINFLVSGDDVPPAVATQANVAEKYKIPYVLAEGPFEPYNANRSSSTQPWQYTWAIGYGITTPASPGDFRAGKPGYTLLESQLVFLNQIIDQTDKKLGLFAADDSDGRSWYASFGPALKKAGIDVIGIDKELGISPASTTDFSSTIQEWMNNKADLIWGNGPAPWFGTLWRQCKAMGFQPKQVLVTKAALFYQDVTSWGGDLPNGIACALWWSPTYQNSPGIGNTTPQSLADGWLKESKQPLNISIGHAYAVTQILFNAIEKAGSLNNDKVNAILAQTDINTICNRVVYDPATHFSRMPVFLGQWQKTDDQFGWAQKIIASNFDFIPVNAKPIFPIPYSK